MKKKYEALKLKKKQQKQRFKKEREEIGNKALVIFKHQEVLHQKFDIEKAAKKLKEENERLKAKIRSGDSKRNNSPKEKVETLWINHSKLVVENEELFESSEELIQLRQEVN